MLRRRRFAHGSLDLDFPEVKVSLDRETGKPLRLERIENDESHQLIEEFMLAANEAVARELKNRLVPTSTASTKIRIRTSSPNTASWC